MNYILFDNKNRANLLPLTYTRPIADLRIGILTIREKWEKYLNAKTTSHTVEYLSKKFPIKIEAENVLINGAICPNEELVLEILTLENNQKLVKNDTIIAVKIGADALKKTVSNDIPIWKIDVAKQKSQYPFIEINHAWELFQKNSTELLADFNLLTKGRKSQEISATNTVIGENIFLEKGAKVECAILNSKSGPIYIGKDAEIMEGAIIRGGLALCDHAILKMGAKVYGATTIGPHCKVGGEVSNSILMGFSNKGHDGFMGNSVVGEWCNLGADTNTSNLKNNYGNVKVWNYEAGKMIDSKQQFCGLIMGDHSKSSINTMFNTGTVVGVCANIFDSGFPPKFIPSFSWGGKDGFERFRLEKAYEVANRMMERRGLKLSVYEEQILKEIQQISNYFHKK